MDRTDLPRIDADDELDVAIATMKDKGCSGVVVELPSGPRVLDVDIILHTHRKEGNVKMSAVNPRVATISLPSNLTAASVLSAEDVRMEVQDRMDDERAVYAVAEIVGGTAAVVTRHERYRDVVAAIPSMWRCQADPNHVWLTNELRQPGNKCRNDNSDVDPV